MNWFSNFFKNLFARFQKVKQNVEQTKTVVVDPPKADNPVNNPVPVVPPVAVSPGPVGNPSVALPKYTGPFFDINGNPDPLGQYTADKWKVAQDLQRQLGAERYNGPVPFAALTAADKAFLTHARINFVGCYDVFASIMSGSLDELNLAIGQGDAVAGHGGYNPDAYQGPMRGYVDQVSKGLLKPNVTHG